MFKKELCKFRGFYLISLLLLAGFLLYLGLGIRAALIHQGGMDINLMFIFNREFSLLHLTELNLFISMLVSTLVFIHERIHARLRLSLHFPRPVILNIAYIVLVGFGCVAALYILEWIIFNVIFSFAYPYELLVILNLALVQNFIFALVLYLFIGGIIIEPAPSQAIVHFVVMLACAYVYYRFNPDIYALPSFYANELGFLYLTLMGIYAINALALAFDHYRQGYIK
ncbi:MAG: hypothetical protein ACTTH5_05585 [Wolinella sp.]